jgi:hypothetical protein
MVVSAAEAGALASAVTGAIVVASVAAGAVASAVVVVCAVSFAAVGFSLDSFEHAVIPITQMPASVEINNCLRIIQFLPLKYSSNKDERRYLILNKRRCKATLLVCSGIMSRIQIKEGEYDGSAKK